MAVVNMLVGAVAPDGATFGAKVDGGGPVRVAVADNEAMTGLMFTASQAVDAQGAAKVSITGLAPFTRYWWQVEDNGVRDTTRTGQFRTDPPAGLPASFTIATASCAGLSPAFPGEAGGEPDPGRVSNHPVYTTLRDRALTGELHGFVNTGDWGYPDFGDATVDTMANRYGYWDANLAQPRQAGAWQVLPQRYKPDDHDYADNDSDGTYPDKANFLQLFTERMPHGALQSGGADGVHESWDTARVRSVFLDVRWNRSPNTDPDGPDKTMLGAAQLSWLENVLTDHGPAKFLIVYMGSQWMHPSDIDTWASFANERDLLAELFGDTGWLSSMMIAYGDRHGAGIDSGGRNLWGRFPVMQAASLDSTPSSPPLDLFDIVNDNPGRNRYGTIAVNDIGSVLSVRLTAWNGLNQLGAHQFTVPGDPPAPIATGALLRTLAGSHTVKVEARVVTGHPTGDDPPGTPLEVSGGQVVLDGTADVRGNLTLSTPGRSDATGRSTFPRLTGDLLSPHGKEIFIRYGVNLGGAGTIWTPLGYYRITRPAQTPTPFGDLQVTGRDRVAGLIKAALLEPRTYPATTTRGFVVMELIEEVYPNAVIVWDDDSRQEPLGHAIVIEDNRFQAIRDIADAVGKLFYVDVDGVFRIETAPAEDASVWQVRAGRGGVLVAASRAVTSEDVHNGLIVKGQTLGRGNVRAVAIDNNPASPTYFFGPFGQSVRTLESGVVDSQAQAEATALAELARSLPTPYELEFTSVPNATLRPWQAVEAVHADGNREVYVLPRVTFPLRPGDHMTGSGRMRIFTSVGSLV